MSRVQKIVDEIIADLCDRRGLKSEWWALDHDIQDEIRERWVEIAEEASLPPDAPADADKAAEALLAVARTAVPYARPARPECSEDERDLCGIDGWVCRSCQEWDHHRHMALCDALAALEDMQP